MNPRVERRAWRTGLLSVLACLIAISFRAQAAGVVTECTQASLELKNSIVAHSPDGTNCFGMIIDRGNNISSDASCNFMATGSLNSTDPIVGELGNYGGPTPTIPLLQGSPAIDAGSAEGCPATDQRGIARPYGAVATSARSSPPRLTRPPERSRAMSIRDLSRFRWPTCQPTLTAQGNTNWRA